MYKIYKLCQLDNKKNVHLTCFIHVYRILGEEEFSVE